MKPLYLEGTCLVQIGLEITGIGAGDVSVRVVSEDTKSGVGVEMDSELYMISEDMEGIVKGLAVRGSS